MAARRTISIIIKNSTLIKTTSPLCSSLIPAAGFHTSNSRLLVGEAGFNYAQSLIDRDPQHLVATCLESSKEEVIQKYPKATMYMRALNKAGAKCLFGVDVTSMKSNPDIGGKQYHEVIFNFPESAVASLDQEMAINMNRNLLTSFFLNARDMLKPFGHIRVILQTGYPYSEWKIKELAAECELKLSKSRQFDLKDFPDYKPLKGAGESPNQQLDFGISNVYYFVRSDKIDATNEEKSSKSEGKENH